MSDPGRSTLILAAAILCAALVPAATLAQSAAPSGGSPSPSAGPVRILPGDPGPLTAGSFVSNVGSGTSVTFDVGDDGWTGAGGSMVVLDRGGAGDPGELIATTFRARVPDPCQNDIGAVVGLPPEAMDSISFTDWLVAQPWAVATKSETTLGGAPAIQVDISALKSACPDGPMFVWTYLDGGPYRLNATEAVRVIAQDQGDDLVLVTAETLHAGSQPTFLGSAMPLIDSMTFDGPIVLPTPAPSISAKGDY